MNKKSSYKIITTGLIGAVLAAAMILSLVATVAQQAEAKPKIIGTSESKYSICYLFSDGHMECTRNSPNGPVAPIVLP